MEINAVRKSIYSVNLNSGNHVYKQQCPSLKVLCVNDRLPYINSGLLKTMKNNNYHVEILPLANYSSEEQKTLLNYVLRDFQPDFVFTPGWSIWMFDTDQFLQTIAQYNIPHIYWATEDPVFFDLVSSVFAPYSDYVFTPAEECNEKYKKMGIPSSTLMFGYNSDIFTKVPPTPQYKHDIVLVANNYNWSAYKNIRRKSIENILEPLIVKGYDIKIWGADWTNPSFDYTIDPKYYGGNIDYLETPYVYSSAKIVLGLQNVNTSLTQTSCRSFEIMGSGAFYLTAYTPSHDHLFSNHYHLVWSNSPQETIKMVDYYLENDSTREAIATQGQKEVLDKHTYFHRLKQMEACIFPILKNYT